MCEKTKLHAGGDPARSHSCNCLSLGVNTTAGTNYFQLLCRLVFNSLRPALRGVENNPMLYSSDSYLRNFFISWSKIMLAEFEKLEQEGRHE